ncbi:uncharacterized protein LOC134652722 [Cydia amplana]|uniref:uncharacterized protein LOC134652722 n=1 Tax=Cydia amplana TaxID=1869771 RepID=UPI002FE61158
MLIALAKCKEEVCKDFGPIQPIYEKNIEKLKEKGGNYLSETPTFSTVKNVLYRARKKYLSANKLVFNRLEEVEVPPTYKNFLVCADGDEEKILIFANTVAKKLIRARATISTTYFGDGTFRCVPKPFAQLYSLHIDLNSTKTSTNVVPVIYGLLPNKTENTYTRFFQLIRDLLGVNITTYKCDYEQAQINAVKNIFPEVEVHGCFHHFNAAFWRNDKTLKTKATKEGRNITRMCALLPLLPPQEMKEAWSSIVDSAPRTTEILNFFQYFRNQWDPEQFAEKLSCSYENHRTTNPLEGWHRRINAYIPKRPNFYYFLHKLMKEARHVSSKINYSLFNKLPKNRQKSDIAFDRKLSKLLQKLENRQISSINFLKKVIWTKISLGVHFKLRIKKRKRRH